MAIDVADVDAEVMARDAEPLHVGYTALADVFPIRRRGIGFLRPAIDPGTICPERDFGGVAAGDWNVPEMRFVVSRIIEPAATPLSVGIDLVEPAIDAVTAVMIVNKPAAGRPPTGMRGAPSFAELGCFGADPHRAIVAVVGLHDSHPEH